MEDSPKVDNVLRMRRDDQRRLGDRVDDFSFELNQLQAVVRAMRLELAEQRARIRELEHDIDDLKMSPNGVRRR